MNRLQTFFLAWILPWVPKRLLSRAVGLLMRLPFPGPAAACLVPLFAKCFRIRLIDAEKPARAYHSFDAFFTRKLKPELRPVEGPRVHPVDGLLTERGGVVAGELIQAKGWKYALAEFLGDSRLAAAYEGGSFFTYYLCPADYHRVHAPIDGLMTEARHIPGLLWPVNQWSVHNIRRLFNLNERVVMNFESPQGRWSLVMVGATNVGHITLTLDPSVTTNRWMWHAPTDRRYTPPLKVRAGDELGVFHLGSTVICLFEKSVGLNPPPGGSLVTKMGGKF